MIKLELFWFRNALTAAFRYFSVSKERSTELDVILLLAEIVDWSNFFRDLEDTDLSFLNSAVANGLAEYS